MFTPDIDNMTDREILVALRIETYHLNEKVTEFIDEQKKENGLIGESIGDIDARVGKLEKSACCEAAVTSWWNSTLTRVGIITGVLIGVAGFILDILWRKG